MGTCLVPIEALTVSGYDNGHRLAQVNLTNENGAHFKRPGLKKFGTG
jgi:hypothetical protein